MLSFFLSSGNAALEKAYSKFCYQGLGTGLFPTGQETPTQPWPRPPCVHSAVLSATCTHTIHAELCQNKFRKIGMRCSFLLYKYIQDLPVDLTNVKVFALKTTLSIFTQHKLHGHPTGILSFWKQRNWGCKSSVHFPGQVEGRVEQLQVLERPHPQAPSQENSHVNGIKFL